MTEPSAGSTQVLSGSYTDPTSQSRLSISPGDYVVIEHIPTGLPVATASAVLQFRAAPTDPTPVYSFDAVVDKTSEPFPGLGRTDTPHLRFVLDETATELLGSGRDWSVRAILRGTDGHSRITVNNLALTTMVGSVTPAPITISTPPTPAVQQPIALGIYTLNKAANAYRDTWASTQLTLVGVAPKIVHLFKPWVATPPEGGSWAAFDPAWATDAIAAGCVPMITWEGRSLAVPASSAQPTYSNAAVIAGTWDARLGAWLDTVQTWLALSGSNRLVLRLDHEGNGRWFPWAAGTNGNSAASAVASFVHKAALIRARAPRVEIMWCPGSSGSGWIPFEQCYPGDAWVDWSGIDFYNTGNLPGGWSGGWVEFSALQPFYDRLVAMAPSKRIIVGETSSVPQAGHDKAAWFANIPAALAAMPKIQGVVVFDHDYGSLPFGISNDPAAYAAYKTLAATALMRGTL